jgi:uncharacterized protein
MVSTDEKRVNELDVLRGFAMLGVYIVNFVEMNATPPGDHGVYPLWNSAIDSFLKWLYHGLFHEKFYLIFVFLFGYSLSFIAVSAQNKNLNVDIIVLRRMISIMLIGLVLAGLCWWGVILVPYAIFGLIMWGLVRAFNERVNIAIALLLVLLVPPVSNHLKLLYSYKFVLDNKALTALYSNGGFLNWIQLIPVQLKGVYWGFFTDGFNSLFYPGQIAYMSMLLGLFMLGWYAAMHKIITNTSTKAYLWVILGGIALFATTKLLDPKDYFYFHRFSQTMAMSAFIIILSRSWESPLTKLFAVIGRTSFSAYAFHLIIGALVFYILGYFQKFSYGILFFCALATYFMAAAACWAMQRRFRSGIFEILMKRMTYGRSNG